MTDRTEPQRAVRAGGTEWHRARELARDAASVGPVERVALDAAIGRVVAVEVRALGDVPHYVSSAMDGWAVQGGGPWRIVAGGLEGGGTATPIVTGGVIPPGTDAVLRSESGEERGRSLVSISPDEPRPGQHLRGSGTEARRGDLVIAAGTRLNPAHVAVAAVCGIDELDVIRLPRVSLLLTGDEVIERGLPAPGQVRDSFGPQLAGFFGMLGATVTSKQRVGDTVDATIAAITTASADSDVVVTTGGTGDSSRDHVRSALASIGATVIVERIAMRPGGPSLLARLADGRHLVGLPGNPLAAMIGLLTLGVPLLASLGGTAAQPLRTVASGVDLDGRTATSIFMPYRMVDGLAVPNRWRDSGMMRGLAEASGVLVVPPDGLRTGDPAESLPLPWG